jgi:NAD(P)-dependent dehydrogenase (short-subunit alcohol dehydrogenase family)
LGRSFVEGILQRGDKVIATARARSFNQIADLQAKGASVLELDVTAPLEELRSIAERAVSLYGRVDVIINNAGYVLGGAVEECTPEETWHQFKYVFIRCDGGETHGSDCMDSTNLFGAVNVTRAFLPYMRERKLGTVVWAGSLAGHQYVHFFCGT